MDAGRFDTLTRILTRGGSRRRALAGMLAGALGLGGSRPDNVTAKKKRKKKPVCLCAASGCTSLKVKNPSAVVAQNPTCNYAGACTTNPCAATTVPPSACIPEPEATTCAGRCATRRNNCGQAIPCPDCPSGQICLLNGTCARPCPGGSAAECVGCRPSSVCSGATTEGQQLCIPATFSCASSATLNPCDPNTTAGCQEGFACYDCGTMGGFRCFPVGSC